MYQNSTTDMAVHNTTKYYNPVNIQLCQQRALYLSEFDLPLIILTGIPLGLLVAGLFLAICADDLSVEDRTGITESREKREHKFAVRIGLFAAGVFGSFNEILALGWLRHCKAYVYSDTRSLTISSTTLLVMLSIGLLPAAMMSVVNLGIDVWKRIAVPKGDRLPLWHGYFFPFLAFGYVTSSAVLAIRGMKSGCMDYYNKGYTACSSCLTEPNDSGHACVTVRRNAAAHREAAVRTTATGRRGHGYESMPILTPPSSVQIDSLANTNGAEENPPEYSYIDAPAQRRDFEWEGDFLC